jgi:hypothetical protein
MALFKEILENKETELKLGKITMKKNHMKN